MVDGKRKKGIVEEFSGGGYGSWTKEYNTSTTHMRLIYHGQICTYLQWRIIYSVRSRRTEGGVRSMGQCDSAG